MKIVRIVIRFLLGLIFVWAGIEKLFIPYDPSVFKANAADSDPLFFEFYDLLQSSGYLYFVGFFQLLCGLLLIFKRTVLLSGIMLIPLILCLWMTHLFFSKNAFYLGFDAVLLLLNFVLIIPYYPPLKKTFFSKQKDQNYYVKRG